MTSRLKRLVSRPLHPSRGGKIVPMSREDEQFWADRRARIEAEKQDREAAASARQPTSGDDSSIRNQRIASTTVRPQVLRSASGGNRTEEKRADARAEN